jgi:ABC-type glycerol-3-phosphate transport system permease component
VCPIPNTLDFAAKVAGTTVFSKIDRIVHPANIPKMAITTCFGLFMYKRM